jgi:hypothetical protein
MPRSGTSLIESILSSHSSITSIGESTALHDTFNQFPSLLKNKNVGHLKSIYDLLEFLDEYSLQWLGEHYIDMVQKGETKGQRIVDKTPLNFLMLGFILQMLPNAKIIHCVRNPVDTCLSIFQQHFSVGHDYAYDLTEIGQFYNLYRRYMKLWQKLFPKKIIDVEYEAVVSETESEVRRLLLACDLSWEPMCVTRDSTNISVNTASKLQVRQPVYQSSVERWRKYEDHLVPLLDELEKAESAVVF